MGHAAILPLRLRRFDHDSSFEELARLQGVTPVQHFEELLGGWPEDEIEDGFEEALAVWRGHEASPQAGNELGTGRR